MKNLLHVTSVNQFKDKNLLNELFAAAQHFYDSPPSEYPKPLQSLTLATLFYEPSTRTRLSFETAIQNLGGQLITVENAADVSSAKKGESLEDTILTLNAYADGIILRHPEVGSADKAAKVSRAPVINAGDGSGEHPTQALLDVFTIYKAKGKLDGLKIGLIGDLLNGRTVHSLVQLLSLYEVEFYLVSPKVLRLPQKYLRMIEKTDAKYQQLASWEMILPKLDVLYMTRVQKERFTLVEDYIEIKDSFVLNRQALKNLNKNSIIMHPLPRINEIGPEVDDDPRAIYFEQVKNGLYMRMALLDHIFQS